MFNILLQKNCLVTKETDNSALHRGDQLWISRRGKNLYLSQNITEPMANNVKVKQVAQKPVCHFCQGNF